MSWVQLLQIENLLFRWTLAVALSIALTTIVGIILLYTTLYTPLVALLALVLIGSGGIVTNWLQSHPRSTTPYELTQVATRVPPQLLLPAPKADGFSAGPVDESV
jgi:hypothetical protein